MQREGDEIPKGTSIAHVNADEIDVVWKEFCEFIGRHIGRDQKGVLVAWNGQSCDLRWIYKLFQAPRSVLSLPVNLEFFMDPSVVIKHYASCKLAVSQKNELVSKNYMIILKNYSTRKSNFQSLRQ